MIDKKNAYNEHMRRMGVDTLEDRKRTEDAYLRAMGQDPDVWRERRSRKIMVENPELRPLSATPATDVTGPPLTEEDIEESEVNRLISVLRHADPNHMSVAMHLVTAELEAERAADEEATKGVLIDGKTLKVDLKH